MDPRRDAQCARCVRERIPPHVRHAPMQFRLIDRGQFTQAELNEQQLDGRRRGPEPADRVYDSRGFPRDGSRQKRVRVEERYPEPYSVEVSGRLDNASGKFVCGGDTPTAVCTVQNTGDDSSSVPNGCFSRAAALKGFGSRMHTTCGSVGGANNPLPIPPLPCPRTSNTARITRRTNGLQWWCQWGHREGHLQRGGVRAICDLPAPR